MPSTLHETVLQLNPAGSRDVPSPPETRGVEVPDDVRTHITQCTDLDQLTVWLRRAVTAASAHDLFG